MHTPSRVTVLARRRARVEIIPLIDVIFFLLATFVLFTLTLNALRTVPVVMPYPGTKDEHPEVVTIHVSGEDTVFWNGESISRAEVPVRLALYQKQAESPRVVIAGDERARFGATVAVLDDVRRAGIASFTVETRVRPTPR